MNSFVKILISFMTVCGLASCGGGGSSTATTNTGGSSSSSTTGTSSGSTPVVTVVVNTLTISPANNTLNVGSSYQLSSVLKDASGNVLTGPTVTWSSSNTAVSSVSSSGLVSGVSPGSASMTASVDGKTATATVSVVSSASATVVVKVDAASAGSAVKDLLGANKKPTAAAQTGGATWDASNLYKGFGVSQVRLHDSGVDLCTTYTAATKLNTGVTPSQAVTGCSLSGSGAAPHFTWTPTSSDDTDLNNPANYDFTQVDEAVTAALASGASIYLRLGDSYNGPNDTNDPVAWAKVATNIYKHVIGVFKPTAGVSVDPVFVEVFNEPDGGFWRGTQSTFNTLYIETTQRVRAAAAAAGRSVKVGGAGFTKSVLTSSTRAGNPANGFIANVGVSTLDFFSAHLYDSCATATLSSSATYLRNLRALVNGQGGSSKPLQITEWNIGLGSQCGNDFYAEQRTQSFASGVLTLMQDPAQNIEAAHFYAGMPLMSLFDFSTVSGVARINPAAWAFWAHSKLKGQSSISTQVCPGGTSCVAGYAADAVSLMALGAKSGNKQTLVITNDKASAVTYTLQVAGLTSTSANVVISTPPAGTRDLSAKGAPVVADASALTTLLASSTQDSRAALTVSAGQLQVTVTVPANALQLIEINAP